MLKTVTRKVVGEQLWLYLSWYRDSFGFGPALLRLARALSGLSAGAPNPLGSHDLYLRPGTADQSVYREVFIEREYDVEVPAPKTIVDAGAHIGLASVYFACRFPDATIFALEPEARNFAMLQRNAARYPAIKAMRVALWNRRDRLVITNPEDATWSFRVSAKSTGREPDLVDALTIPDLMESVGIRTIDILKMDIEGAELQVLEGAEAWIESVGTLIIELHDRLRPGCTRALERALRRFDYTCRVSGESVIVAGIRSRPKV